MCGFMKKSYCKVKKKTMSVRYKITQNKKHLQRVSLVDIYFSNLSNISLMKRERKQVNRLCYFHVLMSMYVKPVVSLLLEMYAKNTFKKKMSVSSGDFRPAGNTPGIHFRFDIICSVKLFVYW